jgi:hypothetical protein
MRMWSADSVRLICTLFFHFVNFLTNLIDVYVKTIYFAQGRKILCLLDGNVDCFEHCLALAFCLC